MSRRTALLVAFALVVVSVPWHAAAEAPIARTQVHLWLPAVGQRGDGTLFGVASELQVTMQTPGSGQVFLSTKPQTEIDMQGSARLAVATAGAVTGLDVSDKDFFFSVDTEAVTVGGPSGGGAMSVAVTALLKGWQLRDDVIMTGMIDPDGSIGPIGGVLQKVEAADSVGADTFLIPLGQGVQSVEDAQTGQTRNVDVRAYARDEFGIEVIEVADLFDALPPFTDHRLIRPEPTTDPLQDAAYAEITRRLGTNLTDSAEARLADVTARYDAEKGSIADDKTVIEQQLATARDRVASARDAQNESHQYLAASLAFQALVALSYADALVTYHEGDTNDAAAYLTTYLAETDRKIVEVGDAVRVTYPIPVSRLDAQAAAEQRQHEALETQTAARAARDEGRLLTALQSSSFARERAQSARWWFQIGLDVAAAGNGAEVTQAAMDTLIAQYRETAQQQLEYAGLIVPGQEAYQAAQASLASSDAARQKGQRAAALFELVDVFAQTSTALVSIAGNEPVRQRLDRLEDAAAYQIELAASEGAPPVYAISLLELGQSRTTSDPVGAYSAYSSARLSAHTSLLAAGLQAPAPRDEAVGRGLFPGGPASLWVVVYVVGSSLVVIVGAAWLARKTSRPGRPEPAPEPDVPGPPPMLVTPAPPVPMALLPPPPEPAPPPPEAPERRTRPRAPRTPAAPATSKPRKPRAPPKARKPLEEDS